MSNDRLRWIFGPLICLSLLLCVFRASAAGPVLVTGDMALRHDIQLLADHGILTGPVTTWPLAWGPILNDLYRIGPDEHEALTLSLAIERLKRRAEWETRVREPTYAASAGVAGQPARIRGFRNNPRESAEIGAGVWWTGEWLALSLNGQLVDQADGDTDARLDGSMIAVALGNWSISLNTLDRWWGPGWDGSLILSNNVRPIPAVSLDRNFTGAFASRLLGWLGPWDLSVTMGQLESARTISDALIFAMRFNFRPLRSLEIGLSRTAQWCGDNRPCDADTLVDLVRGRDNSGDSGVEFENEPGNQLAGLDFRFSTSLSGRPLALYGQFIGEDEAGGLPSRYLGQFGAEFTGTWRGTGSWRVFAEFAGTSCRFHETSKLYNCAYNHGIYNTGYRYRGRPIGHGADNDAELVSAGLLLVEADGSDWQALLRGGEINRGGEPDPRNTLSAVPADIASIDLSHSRMTRFGRLEFGLGYEQIDRADRGRDSEIRGYFQWRSAY